RADGQLEYLGRIDFQVKVRGFRIELGEVEEGLRRHPGVQEAVVVARGEGGDKKLVGYVSVKAGQQVEAAELQELLKQHLPRFMVPSVLVVLAAMPLNPNGKIDRKALPEPDMQGAGQEYVAPSTPTEELLASVWMQVLKVARAGRDDDFFALGGHSLVATQVVSRVRTQCGVELPLRAVFEAPVLRELAARIDALGKGRAAPPLKRVARDGKLPLSFAQQRLWFLDQMEPGSASYNIPFAVRLRGEMDAAALEKSLAEVVRRHEALRTTFEEVDGQPVQHIQPAGSFRLNVEDVSHLPEAQREAAARQRVEQEARRPFDLGRELMLKALLVKVAPTEGVLVVNMHHIASDGWSLGVFVKELVALYEAYSEGKAAGLEELPVQYADYAVWQREWLQGEVLEEQVEYWRQKLAGVAPLELPTDKPRPAVQTYRGATVPVKLPSVLAKRVREVAQQEGVTPFMLLLAVWQTLLGRYSGQQDVSVGMPIAGRRQAEVEGLIGFFVNTLVVRAQVEGAKSFRELLAQVKETTLGAYAHQDVPFEKLVEELRPERDLGRAPLFQVMFSLQNAPMPELEVKGLTLRLEELSRQHSKFDLSLALTESAEGLDGLLEYSTDLYEAGSVERMAHHFQVLLESALARPEARVSELRLLDEAERRQVLVEWNATGATYPRDSSVHAVFEAQVDLTPDAVAVVDGGEVLTYAQLERRANQLAQFLRSQGLTLEERVGLCLERSADLIVAMLGVLKAGGVYVPLDSAYPADRLGFMVADSHVRLLVTHGTLAQGLDTSGLTVVRMDEDRATLDAASAERPRGAVSALGLAYVIYTSGSTGRPKGVEVEHRPIVRLVKGTDFAQIQSEDRMAQLSNTSFDAATFEVWGALLNGAALVVVPREVALVPAELTHLLREQRITAMFLTTSLFNQVARELPDAFETITHVVIGGEAADPVSVRRVLAAKPPRRLVNGYGPTETTTFATWHLMNDVAEGVTSIPIGRPLKNSTGYVLDRNLNLVPVGVPGELYVGGDGVGRGYQARPELTAEKFMPDPFSAEPGARMYRTGDRARLRADGVIEYLGRQDQQVKLRGFRIELEEISAALQAHAGVKDAVALVREVSPGDKRLVAYVIPTGEEAPAPAELKVHLARTLPDYMVPSAYVVLKAWPLTPNGKLDRAALPAPTGSDAGVGEADNAPRTPVEETLTKIFAEVLGVERVGRGDDFFELGGHSLLATRLVSRVRSGLRVELPLRALFESRTPERLAARVETLVQQAAGAKVPPLKRAAREGKLPLSFAQQRLWFLDQMEPGSASYNIPFAVTLRGAVDAEALEKSLAEVVRRHEALRTTFEEVDGQPVQHIQPAGSFRLERADVSHLPEAQREAAARQHVETAARKPFHLGRELMLKALLVKVGPAERVLVVNMHHIASDGWSLGVFVKELAALYEAYSEGKEAALPELPVQYADYAVWQRGWLKDEVLGEQVEYWRQKLAGVAPLELPTDKPRPAVQTYRGATVPVKLPGALSKQVVALAQQEGVTPFMLLLAAWQTLLGRYSGQQDVSVGMPIAGRRQAEVEGLIGFFVNTLVVRTQVEGTKSFRELLAQVKEAALGAYAHQDVPFEKLVEELKPERNLGRAPLFQVMFSLQNASMPELEVKGLTLRQVDVKRDTAKFDLSLALTDTAEGLHGSLEYSTDLYEAGTVERMVRHFQVLLESVVARPEARVGELALLEAAERQQVLVAWNPTRVESSSVACVQELFEAQADRTPDVLAVACGGQSLTYRQLDQRANRLANRLRRLGVGPEARVGLWMERSVDLVVGMLATLKAGGAYVPVDADYPEARARLLLEDSGLSVLVSEQSLLKRLSSLPGGAVALALDTEDLGAESDARPARVTTPDNAAYVIYTSGSTGRPKGVVVEHRHLWHLLRWHLEAYSVKPGDRASQVASPAFDAAVWEIWPYLVSGAALDLPDRDTRLEPARLVAWLVERGITVAFLPTPLCEAVLAEPWPAETRLRWLLTGGDKLSRRPSPDAPFRLVNHYGPTEATVVATAGEVLATGSGRDPSIGGPISHARIYVLDEHQAPQPVGVPGELYVAGAGVARGYLERPEQTAERFVLDPFSEEPGARMYRTGDRVRWLTDGTLEFLGRMDFQVKIRGYRIELGEIEAVLSQQPAVLHAVVVVRQAVGRPQRLVAYVVPRQGQTVDTEALRAFLQSRLPEYMVPAAFLVLEALPLTPNGKVDRKALPEPEDRGSEQAFVAPLTPTETVLAELWAQVLSVPRVGRHESFFELGGHSLMATQVMARIRGAWGVELPLRAMFEAPTLEALAARIDQAKSGPGRKVPALEPVRRDGPLPLSFAQQRLW
ncbi:amino acid adenylation domain-containing protein, partial [Archangium sp.]|uniref:amino acid adenylation domain-containing protein n=1 Tax=Archangium sp. TaxID=1872627 RepID=UPI002EDB1B64